MLEAEENVVFVHFPSSSPPFLCHLPIFALVGAEVRWIVEVETSTIGTERPTVVEIADVPLCCLLDGGHRHRRRHRFLLLLPLPSSVVVGITMTDYHRLLECQSVDDGEGVRGFSSSNSLFLPNTLSFPPLSSFTSLS